ncbi:hypothetical protein NTJ56_20865 [Burkholderia contaminans]|uniref:hypothetical protein n=1 Tax=Burkholderia contaminans TaxID=488447 RepID=UPI001CF5AB60|nr:hypothetical protein [Burkholderia contaminans]MCA7915707.1 hypothetical protein [Burkholderia contaminans]UUX40890.1 hypothetical protein NTJ56_20865 [Burkholderia contaminans]
MNIRLKVGEIVFFCAFTTVLIAGIQWRDGNPMGVTQALLQFASMCVTYPLVKYAASRVDAGIDWFLAWMKR